MRFSIFQEGMLRGVGVDTMAEAVEVVREMRWNFGPEVRFVVTNEADVVVWASDPHRLGDHFGPF